MKSVAAGMNPMDQARHRSGDCQVSSIKAAARDNPTATVAQYTISANGEREIRQIADAMQKVGNEGDHRRGEQRWKPRPMSTRAVRPAIELYFVTNSDKMTVELEDAIILLQRNRSSSPRSRF